MLRGGKRRYSDATWQYSYDLGGNIQSKTYYPYTQGDLTGITGTETGYTYGDGNWKDKLTAYDGKGITYNAIGNPLSYDGWSYTWEGRRLMGMSRSEMCIRDRHCAAGYADWYAWRR